MYTFVSNKISSFLEGWIGILHRLILSYLSSIIRTRYRKIFTAQMQRYFIPLYQPEYFGLVCDREVECSFLQVLRSRRYVYSIPVPRNFRKMPTFKHQSTCTEEVSKNKKSEITNAWYSSYVWQLFTKIKEAKLK